MGCQRSSGITERRGPIKGAHADRLARVRDVLMGCLIGVVLAVAGCGFELPEGGG
jgi:hypothetical protein